MKWSNAELKLTSVSNCKLQKGSGTVDFDWLYDGQVMVTCNFTGNVQLFSSKNGGARVMWNELKNLGFVHVNPRKRKTLKQVEAEANEIEQLATEFANLIHGHLAEISM